MALRFEGDGRDKDPKGYDNMQSAAGRLRAWAPLSSSA
jgi:hypothetical protein